MPSPLLQVHRRPPAPPVAAAALFEPVEPRLLLAFAAKINFQPNDGIAVPAGYVIDSGLAYGARNGLTYGWSADVSAYARRRNSSLSPDARYDSLVMMQGGGVNRAWEIAVPSGRYRVRIVAGDPAYPTGRQKLIAETSTIFDVTTDPTHRWVDKYAVVDVNDGRLSLSPHTAEGANIRVNFVEITDALTSAVERPPVLPPITKAVNVGIHLDGIADYSTISPFTDLATYFRRWGNVDLPQNEQPGLPLTADNYPLADAGALTFAKAFPDGEYQVSWRGQGTVSFEGMQSTFTVTGQADGVTTGVLTIVHPEVPESDWLRMRFTNINTADPIRDMHIIAPDVDPAYGPFRKSFVERVAAVGSGPIRFMDWMQTNSSPVVNWSDRATTARFSYASKLGVPYEQFITLANLTHRDVWINVPHAANDNYVRELARLFRDTLDPSLHIYLEYSNEIWSGGSVQGQYLNNLANSDSELTASGFGRAAQEAAKQLVRIGDLFRSEFGAARYTAQVRPEFGCLIANDFWADTAMKWIRTKYGDVRSKVYGIAVGLYVGNESDMSSINTNDLTPETLFAWMNNWIDTTIHGWLTAHKKAADTFELSLDTYEAGQHLQALSNEVNEPVKRAAQTDPRMGDVYVHLMQRWMQDGGDLFEAFSLATYNSKFGYWGLLESIDQTTSVKYATITSLAGSTYTFASQLASAAPLGAAPPVVLSAAQIDAYANNDGPPAPLPPAPLPPVPPPVKPEKPVKPGKPVIVPVLPPPRRPVSRPLAPRASLWWRATPGIEPGRSH